MAQALPEHYPASDNDMDDPISLLILKRKGASKDSPGTALLSPKYGELPAENITSCFALPVPGVGAPNKPEASGFSKASTRSRVIFKNIID
ncbi:hypothetical protein SAMN06265379_11066 [Saccharicrinis carchari]|uniref:Uncharacterized protein n=1 Tax=Saccharicrinis carchari TaxID=1168039 RepID=A0A521EQZ7_SACCC|nr:hypothetical protein SAMN06265379_11066 [Saccharicrinis carchari]